MKKSALLVIFLLVFVDLIGFGIVLPLLPMYADMYSANGLTLGGIVASYSLMQFLFAPAWGRLSDRVGRKPVILISLFGTTASYALFALSAQFEGQTGLYILLASRLFAGVCGANVSVASAYIADISPPEIRSKRMGLVGMAFGLGFILGPALGAISANYFGLQGPGWVASIICGINFLAAIFVLQESRGKDAQPVTSRPGLQQWKHTLGQPKIGLLIGIFFLATFCFVCFETTFSLVLKVNFGFTEKNIGWLFAYCGFVSAMVQGGMIGRLVKKHGEPPLIVASLLILSVAMVLLPLQKAMPGLLMGLAVFAVGSGINRPPTFGMISLLTSDEEQGAVMGVAQSVGALARIIGPFFAGILYEFSEILPYMICAGVALLAAGVAMLRLRGPVIPVGHRHDKEQEQVPSAG